MNDDSSKEVEGLIGKGLAPETAREIVSVVDGIVLQASRLGYNTGRVNRLIDVADTIRHSSDAMSDEILRAAVVLLHATLE